MWVTRGQSVGQLALKVVWVSLGTERFGPAPVTTRIEPRVNIARPLGSVTGVICLDENLALDFLSGTMSPAAVAEAESHLAECGACVDLIAASAQLLRPRL